MAALRFSVLALLALVASSTQDSWMHGKSSLDVAQVVGSASWSAVGERLHAAASEFRMGDVVTTAKLLRRLVTPSSQDATASTAADRKGSDVVMVEGVPFLRSELHGASQLSGVLGPARRQRLLSATPAGEAREEEVLPDGSSRRRLSASTTPPLSGSPACGSVGRQIQVNSTQAVCGAVPVTGAQREAVEGAVTTLSDEESDAAARAAAQAAVLAVPGLGGAAVDGIPPQTPLPAGLNLTSALTPSQQAALLASANVSSLANVTTFGQLSGIVAEGNASANGTLTPAQLLQALPPNTTAQILAGVQCEDVPSTALVCVCPVDFSGAQCETPREWGCTSTWADPHLHQCLASGGSSPGADLTSPTAAPLSRVGALEYRPGGFGMPPCVFAARGGELNLTTTVTCAFSQPVPLTCNGTVMDAAFFGGASAVAGLEASQAPYFGRRCVEADLPYALPGLQAANWSELATRAAATVTVPLLAPLALTLLPNGTDGEGGLELAESLTPVDFQALSHTPITSRVTIPLAGLVRAADTAGGARPPPARPRDAPALALWVDAAGGGWSVAVHHTLRLGQLPGQFWVGGRVYLVSELTQQAPLLPPSVPGVGGEPVLLAQPSVAPPSTLAVDDVQYEEPPPPPPDLLLPILLPLLAAALLAAAAAAYWRWSTARQRAEQAKLEQEGFGLFSEQQSASSAQG